MPHTPDHPTQRPCLCGGANPHCPQCGGSGVVEKPGFRPIMTGPAGIRRRPFVPRDNVGTTLGPPVPVKCPHCGFEVLNLAVHLAETHPDQPQGETAAEREAREQEEARQAAVAAEIARSEAEAARRKAEARARREAVEGPQGVVAWPQRAKGIPKVKPATEHSGPERPAAAPTPGDPTSPAGVPDASTPGPDPSRAGGSGEKHGTVSQTPPTRPADDAWERIRRAMAERTVLTGTVRSCKPFGTFVALEEIEGLVRSREIPGDATDLHVGQPVKVVVIGIREDEHRVELSMRRAQPLQPPPKGQSPSGMGARPPEGPMALAFRMAREKQKRSE